MSLYWKLQLAGWSALVVWQLAMVALFTEFAPRLGWAVAGFTIVGVMGLVLTHLFRGVMHRGGWKELPPGRLAPRVIVATLGIATVMGAGSVPFTIPNAPEDSGVWMLLVSNTVGCAFAVVGWFLLYFCYHFLKRSRAAAERELELRVAMRDAELGTLRAQLNPHFLFNSLNSLRGLIPESPERAQEAVTSLAGLLRHSLRLSSEPTVPLRRELEAARHYLALEKIRFEQRLEVEFEVAPGVAEQPVPPLVLQTMVENALKHGIAQRRDGGTVRVEVRSDSSGDVVLSVLNPGRIRDPVEPGGVGLANVRRQLDLLWGDRATLQLSQETADWVVCRVRVPRGAGA